jgi:hypothetical protein
MIETGRGCVFATHFRWREVNTEVLAMTNLRMDIVQAYRRLGHLNEDMTRKSAQIFGWQNCDACAVAEAQQKNVVRLSKRPVAESPNQRVFIDLARIKKKENLPEPTLPHWLIVVDVCTLLDSSLEFGIDRTKII